VISNDHRGCLWLGSVSKSRGLVTRQLSELLRLLIKSIIVMRKTNVLFGVVVMLILPLVLVVMILPLVL